jgi:hypothetical protein
LSGNLLTGTIPESLGALSYLQCVVMVAARPLVLCDAMTACDRDCHRRYLDLRVQYRLKGSIPESLGSLSYLTLVVVLAGHRACGRG